MFTSRRRCWLLGLVMILLAAGTRTAWASAPAEQVIHWVRSGETLANIARQHSVAVSDLVSTNRLTQPNLIYTGQRLVIPGGNAETLPAEQVYVVRRGDTLASIAARFGVSISELVAMNGLRNAHFIWVGQRLRIPGIPTSNSPGVHLVQRGETLAQIAALHRVSIGALVTLNQLRNASLIFVGQRLLLPTGGSPAPGTGQPSGKWIDVNLTRQQVTAYEGDRPVRTFIVSTGVPRTPTVTGRYRIYLKVRIQDMSGGSKAGGDYYYLPNVPWVQYFYKGYAFHGTYWHNNFGRPMSRGCVNMRIEDAKWLFDWAEPAMPAGIVSYWVPAGAGTLVVIHY